MSKNRQPAQMYTERLQAMLNPGQAKAARDLCDLLMLDNDSALIRWLITKEARSMGIALETVETKQG